MKLLSIPEEATACRAAWAGVPVGAMAWHCHHEMLAERLYEPADVRISFILTNKPKHERALRLRLFRPARAVAVGTAYDAYLVAAMKARAARAAGERKAEAAYGAAFGKAYDAVTVVGLAYDAAIATADDDYDAAIGPSHVAECSDCPWDGKTIFPEAV